jgi:hypothetical protein
VLQEDRKHEETLDKTGTFPGIETAIKAEQPYVREALQVHPSSYCSPLSRNWTVASLERLDNP